MSSDHIYSHAFTYKRDQVRLLYTIVEQRGERQFVLEDVLARNLQIVNNVPDWVIEREALRIAVDHGAAYT